MKSNKWFILFAMIICLSLIFIDQTALPVALPVIVHTLKTSSLMLQWILNSYLLALTICIIATGKLTDILGAEKIFFRGMILFFIASCGCAFSQNIVEMLLARVLQGIAAAMILPAAGVILISTFDFQERGKAMGIYIGSASIFLAIGPMIGGTITQYFGWQWIFLLNAPLVCISVLIFFYYKKNISIQIRDEKLDFFGFFLLFTTIASFIFSLMQAADFGWHSPIILGLIVMGFISLFIFMLRSRRQKNSLIDIELFKETSVWTSTLLIIFTQCAIISIAFWPSFIENIFSFSPQQAGFALLPVTLPVMLISPFAGQLMDKHGPRLPVALGCFSIAIGACWIALFISQQNYWLLIPGLVLYGCGPSFLLSCIMTYLMNIVAPNKRGEIAGVTSFIRQLGSVFGLAVIGSVISHVNQSYTSTFSYIMFVITLFAVLAMLLLKKLPNYAISHL